MCETVLDIPGYKVVVLHSLGCSTTGMTYLYTTTVTISMATRWLFFTLVDSVLHV